MTIATDIVHIYRIVNHILAHHTRKTTVEIAQELFVPQPLIENIYLELSMTCNDGKILKDRRKKKIVVSIEQPDFIVKAKALNVHAGPWTRPKAEYSNTSPYGIADDLHKHPEKYGMVM